jgi:FMN phosphatase YigB (HAD superfamily)
MSKRVVLDIDGILWDIGPEWHKELIKINPDCPVPGAFANWDFYEEHMTLEQALECVKRVHMHQYEYKPFPGVSGLTRMLRMAGYDIVIASHRDPDSAGATLRWMSENNIQFDDLYVGFDKHPLLDDCCLFIDDNPKSQQIALDKGIDTYSIRYDYNEHVEGVVFADDFRSLTIAVLEWVQNNRNKEVIGV